MDYSFRNLIGKHTLIVGDVHSGKTLLMSDLLKQALKNPPRDRIVVLDFAPNVRTDEGIIGKRLKIPTSKHIDYIAPQHVHAPRLEGRDAKEVLLLAEKNRSEIDAVLRKVDGRIVFLNDATLYLHSGTADTLIRIADKSETFIANAYKGKRLSNDKGSGVSLHEAEELRRLAEEMDLVINLG